MNYSSAILIPKIITAIKNSELYLSSVEDPDRFPYIVSVETPFGRLEIQAHYGVALIFRK